jgi:hypothetical protein
MVYYGYSKREAQQRFKEHLREIKQKGGEIK